MLRMIIGAVLGLAPTAQGCGLDWSIPQAHFDGVEEHGYVAYWEKIGEADLGDRLTIPVYIGFNSHRAASSPTLGQGWTLPLLESHVEPVDENAMNVIMPDGWTFLFLRNGNTDTWRGNAGWVGETDGTRFTISAPCGWRVKFDCGKIQEIDTPKNRTIAIRYNGNNATEADIDNQPFVQVEDNTATGVAQDIVIGGQKIELAQAPRPSINTILGQTFITGFNPSLSQLQWPDGKKESFDFTPGQDLIPILAITKPDQTQRDITWDPATTQIITDGAWTYHLKPGNNVALARTNAKGQSEYFSSDAATGTTVVQGLDGVEFITRKYVNAGNLTGQIRKVTEIDDMPAGRRSAGKTIYAAAYDEDGTLIREQLGDGTMRVYTSRGELASISRGSQKIFVRMFDAGERMIYQVDFARKIAVKCQYVSDDEHIDSIYHNDILLYTRDVKADRIVNLKD